MFSKLAKQVVFKADSHNSIIERKIYLKFLASKIQKNCQKVKVKKEHDENGLDFPP